MKKIYRKGAVGALIDEYERAVSELKELIEQVSTSDYEKIFDAETANADCRSIQTIMSHVVRACFGYANYIRKYFSIESKVYEPKLLAKNEVIERFDESIIYTIETLEHKWEMSEDEMTAVSMKSNWGVVYDLEQLLEHAIVHILRHRRQIEKFLANGNSN